MKILVSPYLIPLVWIGSAVSVYFPSQYFPYERDVNINLAVAVMSMVAITASTIAFYFDSHARSSPHATSGIRYRRSYRYLSWVIIFYIFIFDVIGFFYLADSVFSSKKFLDSATFVKWPINFKLLSGFIIGYFLSNFKREFFAHLAVSAIFSFLFAERLHLMEFLVAFAVGVLCRRQVTISLMRILQVGLSFILIFIGFEATRNFYVLYFVKGSGISITDAIWNLTERLAAYYGDTTNKFSVVLSSEDTQFVPFHYVLWLKTQIFKDNSWFGGVSIGNLADAQGASFENLTNIGSFALLYSDFGAVSLLFCIFFGVIPSFLYFKFKKMPTLVTGVLLVIFVINALEFTRIFYVFNLRGWMSLLPLFGLIFLRMVLRRV